jgi:hypothetical protein
MGVTDQLGAPVANDIFDGYYTLGRFWRNSQAVASPGTCFDIYGVQVVAGEAPSPKMSKDVYQQGGGNEFFPKRRLYQFSGSITMLAGKVMSFLTSALGLTMNLSNYVAQPFKFHPYPMGTLEMICRDEGNVTHLMSKVYQDIILMPFNMGSPMEDEEVAIPFLSQHDPFLLYPGCEIAYDQFNGDDSSMIFTLNSVPLAMLNSTLAGNEDWIYDNAVYVKTKTATQTDGTRQTTATVASDKSVTLTAAPATGTTVQVMYVKAT